MENLLKLFISDRILFEFPSWHLYTDLFNTIFNELVSDGEHLTHSFSLATFQHTAVNPDSIISSIFLLLFGSVIFLLEKTVNNSDDFAHYASTFTIIIVKTIELNFQSLNIEALLNGFFEIANEVFFHLTLNVHRLVIFFKITVSCTSEINFSDLLRVNFEPHILDILIEGLEAPRFKEFSVLDDFFDSLFVHGDMSSFIN